MQCAYYFFTTTFVPDIERFADFHGALARPVARGVPHVSTGPPLAPPMPRERLGEPLHATRDRMCSPANLSIAGALSPPLQIISPSRYRKFMVRVERRSAEKETAGLLTEIQTWYCWVKIWSKSVTQR